MEQHDKLLYEIAKLTREKFDLEMIDRWNVNDMIKFDMVSTHLRALVSKYIDLYERRPPFDSMDDVMNVIKRMETNDN